MRSRSSRARSPALGCCAATATGPRSRAAANKALIGTSNPSSSRRTLSSGRHGFKLALPEGRSPALELCILAPSVRLLLAAALAAVSGTALAAGHFEKIAAGILVRPDHGPAKAVRLDVYGDGIVRVTEAPTARIDVPPSL